MTSTAASGNIGGGDIPKIQLESREDVQFLKSQFSDFLEKTMSTNAALRDAPLTDEQRKEASALVLSRLQQWSEGIWCAAGQSIAVNGFPYEEAMAEKSKIEPLDESLKSEVEALREEADSLLLSVTAKRRTVPSQIETLVSDSVWRESLAAEHTRALKEQESTGEEASRDLPYIDDRINGEFQNALGVARKLASEAPGTVGRLERLVGTLEETKKAVAREKAEDERTRWVLVDKPKGEAQKASGSSTTTQDQLLAYRAALHAITADK
ncbi:hypothetical protein GQ54DRAFT_198064 [Martensiomyces pterosporus]|nr:hypothetical protein GQ54DRAFT_198064 [Martensiomyces pterosporus]